MPDPITISCGNRRAVITGQHVSLQKLHNKKKATGIWPERPVADAVKRLYVAQAWVLKGYIDDDFVNA